MKFPVEINVKGESEHVQWRREGQLGVIEENEIVVWNGVSN